MKHTIDSLSAGVSPTAVLDLLTHPGLRRLLQPNAGAWCSALESIRLCAQIRSAESAPLAQLSVNDGHECSDRADRFLLKLLFEVFPGIHGRLTDVGNRSQEGGAGLGVTAGDAAGHPDGQGGQCEETLLEQVRALVVGIVHAASGDAGVEVAPGRGESRPGTALPATASATAGQPTGGAA